MITGTTMDVEGRCPRVRRAATDGTGVTDERIEILNVHAEPVLSLTLEHSYQLARMLIDVNAEIAEAYPTVLALMSAPAVTAADLATTFEMGRQAGAGIRHRSGS